MRSMKRDVTGKMRLSHEPPAVTARLGWRYHHIGIPHTQPRAQEHHVAPLGVHVAGFETSPYGIEWIRFEPHCHVPEIVRIVPHIAFSRRRFGRSSERSGDSDRTDGAIGWSSRGVHT